MNANLSEKAGFMNEDERHTIDRIQTMMKQVQFYHSIGDFSGTNLEKATSTASCRMKMCKWCYQLVDYFKFSRETVQIGMSYFDRFLSTDQGRQYPQDRSGFQLACITCMYIAIKVHEPMELDVALLCDLSRGSYSVSEITKMEQVILHALHWRLNPPTATSFVKHFFSLLPSSIVHDKSDRLHNALHQAELSVFDYSLVLTATSLTIATAAVSNALKGTDISLQLLIPSVFSFFPDLESIFTCREKLLLYVQRNLRMPMLQSSAERPVSSACKTIAEASEGRAVIPA